MSTTPQVDPRPVHECKRCTYIWRQAELDKPPTWCPRCGSAAWSSPPQRSNARRPSDPPNPRWKQRKQGAQPRDNGDREYPSSLGKVGIPRNYILDPPVLRAGGLPAPPPRTRVELPPPPSRMVDARRLDESHWPLAQPQLVPQVEFPQPDAEHAIAAAQGEDA